MIIAFPWFAFLFYVRTTSSYQKYSRLKNNFVNRFILKYQTARRTTAIPKFNFKGLCFYSRGSLNVKVIANNHFFQILPFTGNLLKTFYILFVYNSPDKKTVIGL